MFGSVEKYQTKKGARWRAVWYVDSVKQSRGGFEQKAQARSHLLAIASKLKGGSAAITVADLIDRFLAAKLELVDAGKRERCTYEDYKYALNRWVASDRLASLKLNDVDTPAINACLQRIALKASSSAVKRVKVHLAVMFGWAAGQPGMIVGNPAREARVDASERLDVPDDDIEFDDLTVDTISIPTPDIVKNIIAAADAFDAAGRAGAQLRMLFFGGMRPSEMLGFPVRAQKLGDDGRLRCKIVQRASKNKPEVGRLKSKTSQRLVVFGKDATLAIRKYLLAGPKEGLLFPTGAGTPVLYSNFRNRVWAPILKAAGAADYTPHHGRHFAISALIASGAQPKRVQAFAGHSSLKLTMDTYGHLFPNEGRDSDLADAINDMVKVAG